ncbi:MAG: hypothetical protein IJV22_07985 [Bacteroidales bacterium]|nr:hypothetical protein [Bacteroidales bacterium]
MINTLLNWIRRPNARIALIGLLYVLVYASIVVLKAGASFEEANAHGFHDDYLYSHALDDTSLSSYLSGRWHGWSSRILIDGALALLCRHFTLWFFLDSLIWPLLLYITTRLLFGSVTLRHTLLCTAALAVFPTTLLIGAALSGNYFWTLTALLGSLLPLRRWHDQQTMKPHFIISSIACACLAADMEITACLGLGLMLVTLFLGKENHPSRTYAATLALLYAVGVVKALICPGNEVRFNFETHWFPLFGQTSWFERIYIGIVSTVSRLLNNAHVLCFFCAIGFIGLWQRRQQRSLNISAALVIVALMVIRVLFILTGYESPIFSYCDLSGHPLSPIFPAVGLAAIALAVIAILYFYVGSGFHTHWLIALILMTLFLGSCFGMCLTPTVYASGERTFTFLYYFLLMAATLMADRSLKGSTRARRATLIVYALALGYSALKFVV